MPSDPLIQPRRRGRLDRFGRDLTVGPRRRPPRPRLETHEPGERMEVPAARSVVAHVLALAVPAALATALIPLRAEHAGTAALVLVVPVVAIAALGRTGPPVVAALAAGVSYGVLLTEPYGRFSVDDADDVVATATLVAVGLVVGVLSSRLGRSTARAATRRDELRHLVEFARATAGPATVDDLAERACAHIAEVLGLRGCRWSPGYHGTSAPVLRPDGDVMGWAAALNPDRARLPRHLELPAAAGGTELGRFVLTSGGDRVASYEERATAGTIASLFAAAALHRAGATGSAGADPGTG